MGNRGETQVQILLRRAKRRKWHTLLLFCLAILVTAGVGGVFHLPAITKTYQVTELTCTAVPPEGAACADFFVHIHNEDCFDAEGNLVCPLLEIKPHRHTAECYSTTRELICTTPESDGHQHTADCYTRVRGDLICTLSTDPVLDEAGNVLQEGHVHTDECFKWTEELSCGMEEGQGAHHHNDSCYETRTTLTCAESEILLHTHTDACYQKNEDGSIYVDEDGNSFLICGQMQVLEHVHGPECFTTYELDDGEPEFIFMEEKETETADAEDVNTEGEELYAEEQETDPQTTEGSDEDAEGNDAEDTEDNDTEDAETAENTEPNAGEENPVASADGDAADQTVIVEEPHTVVYTGTRGAEKGGMTVLAEIPEGALDENVQLILTDADENAARKQILRVINENAAEGEEREISSMLLLDIGFAASGEPAALNGLDPIRVTLRAAAIRGMSAPKLFHLSNGTAQEVKDVLFDTEAGSVVFTSSSFSPFAVVDLTGEEQTEETTEETAEETVSESMPASHFEAETAGVLITVDAPEGAFPKGTTMVVSPIEMDDDTLSNVTDAVENGSDQKVVTAQAVDISFFDAEQNLIEPKLPIKVSMKSAIVSESENVALVHLNETGTAETSENETPETPAAPTAEVVTDVQVVENANEDNEIQFESDAFSVYVLVGTETITTRYLTADGQTYLITVTCGPEAMIPEGAGLAVTEIPQNSEEYANYLAQAQSAVNAGENSTSEADNDGNIGSSDRVTVTTARFFDITILDAEGNPVEPAAPVDVKIEYMEPAETAENYQVVHFGEETEVLNPVVSGTYGSASTFDFKADSFSVFGIIGTTIEKNVLASDGITYRVSVTYGAEAGIPDNSELEVEELLPDTEAYAEELSKAQAAIHADDEDIYIYQARFFNIHIVHNGKEIQPKDSVYVEITAQNISSEGTFYITHTHATDTELLTAEASAISEDEIVFSFETTSFSYYGTINAGGAATLEVGDTATLSTTHNNNSWTSNDTSVIRVSGSNTNRATITAVGSGVAVVTHTYRIWGTTYYEYYYFVVSGGIKVYVYVGATYISNDCLEILGIDPNTKDRNGYFPAGEIYLSSSFLNGKEQNANTPGQALLLTNEDIEELFSALSVINTNTLIGVYAANIGNSVGDYIDQAGRDLRQTWGSGNTALFRWNTDPSYGFEDQTVKFHLDLRFETHRVTFITGNNGIRTGRAKDGTTVDVRPYIVGSPIQQPRNLVIPAGYRFVGYYNDSNFTTPWDKIGTPLTQDELVYIKITPQENVILYYKPVPAGGGTVSLDAEGVNPETGTPRGSTATANPGYSFVGWYADEECTQLLSTNATYVPTKGSSEHWEDGTTYYAKFVENTVTLTFKAEDHIDHLEMNSVPENVVSYEFSEDRKTLTVVLDAASGSPVTVTGIPETGYAVKEWTIDGRSGALTTADSLTTAKTDDPTALNGLWTDRTYRVRAEVLKTITVTKEVNIIGTLDAEDVDATVYFALKDMSKDPAPWVYNKDGSIYTTSIQLVDGVPQGTAQFVDLPAGTYEVWEVADADAGSFGPGSEIADGIVVSRIQTWISDTDTGNDVILSDTDPHGAIKVINTLNHANEAMTFWANKKWFTVKNSYADANAQANVDVPAGAWVDFTLYRINADGSEDEVQTIRLDGSRNDIGEEEPWAAAFRDLAKVDHEGNSVSYYVRETAMADLSEHGYYTTFNDTTSTNGGSISNVVAYGNVKATKEIDLPADISDEDKQAFLEALQIEVVGPAEVDESRRITRTFGKDDFTITESAKDITYGSTTQSVKVLTLMVNADDLPAGTYTVAESGYNTDTLAYQWDPARSWIKADKLPSDQSSLVNTEQYGKVSIDVPVGVNVTDNNFTTTINLLNSYVVQDIKATKVWDDLGIEDADHPSVSLTLYRTDGSGNKSPVSTQIIGANQTGDNLTLTWTNQPQTYTYSVEEAPVKGYSLESVTGNATEGFVITNKRAAVIRVVKTDQAGTALAGAVFSDVSGGLLKNGPVTTVVTGEPGAQEAVILENQAVPIGTYTIREDAAPAGYNPLSGDVTIEVTLKEKTGQILVSAKVGGAESAFAHAEMIDVDHPELGWKVTIKNNAGVELPSTGGPGTGLFTAIGGMMTAMAGAVLTLKKRKEHA